MTELVYFLGRYHVLAVHLPIGILLLAATLEALSRHGRFRSLEPALPVIWLAGALTALFALILGYMHATEGGFDARTINLHRWSASAVVFFAFAVWAIRGEAKAIFARVWPAAPAGAVALVALTGHYGGNLTHGPTYLAEHAPGPLRAWMGAPPHLAPRPPPASLAEADIFLDVVAPALRDRCGSCHNDARLRGGLSLTSHAAILAGGESGPVIAPGDAEGSDLMRRITLPPEDVDYMPKNGKPPLTDLETAAIAWWINVGAPGEGLVSVLQPTSDAEAAIALLLGVQPTGEGAAEPGVRAVSAGGGRSDRR
jgi:hypothetical protein